MRSRKVSDEVLYAADAMVSVCSADMDALAGAAAGTPRRRIRICAHPDAGDPLHEMLIVLGKGNYIRPHRHAAKSESFHVIKGSADIVLFDESGKPEERIRLGDYRSGRSFYFRMNRSQFHSVVVSSEFFVFHETTNGPFDRSDTEFAPWSPEEGDIAAGNRFLEEALAQLEVSHDA